jgi:hypothetical protein
VAEVVDFVDFLTAREERAAAARRLTQGLAKLDALHLAPISKDEVEDEVQAARRDRCNRKREASPLVVVKREPSPLVYSLWFTLFVPFVSQKRRLSFQRRKSNTKTFHCQDCNSSVRVPPVKKAEPACSLRFIFTKPTPGQYHSWVTKGKSRQPVAGSA